MEIRRHKIRTVRWMLPDFLSKQLKQFFSFVSFVRCFVLMKENIDFSQNFTALLLQNVLFRVHQNWCKFATDTTICSYIMQQYLLLLGKPKLSYPRSLRPTCIIIKSTDFIVRKDVLKNENINLLIFSR